jgi:hypothetical protein
MFSLIMATTMLVVVFAVAALFSFSSFMFSDIQGTKRVAFVVLLWLYGAYRSYRLYVLLKSSKNNEA